MARYWVRVGGKPPGGWVALEKRLWSCGSAVQKGYPTLLTGMASTGAIEAGSAEKHLLDPDEALANACTFFAGRTGALKAIDKLVISR